MNNINNVNNNKRMRYVINNVIDNTGDNDNNSDNNSPKTKRTKYDDTSIKAVRFPDKFESSIFLAGDREVHFNTHVSGETITRLKKLISKIVDECKEKLVRYENDGSVLIERKDDPPVVITYIVNSPGGSVHDVLDFVDYINFLRCKFANIKFTSIITGMVASAGTIMCIIADTRKMTRFAFAMIHEISTGLGRTNYTRVMTHAELMQNLHNVFVTIYQECRSISMDDQDKKNELENLLKNETWMDAKQYKDNGFIDEIIAVHPYRVRQ